MPKPSATPRSQRPKALTVFAAAFVAGAVAAVGINRALDVHLAQAKPQVECEPIFVALRDLAQGSPVTIWDVALRDWPKAMLPTTALRADDRFEGMLVKHPVREGQPLLSVQLVAAEARAPAAETAEQVVETYAPRTFAPAPAAQPDADLWAAAEEPVQQAPAVAQPAVAPVDIAPVDVVATAPTADETAAVIEPSGSPADIAVEAVTAPVETAVPEPTISTPSIDEVVSAADIPPLMPTDEPAPVTSIEPSATTAATQPEAPSEPGEPAVPADVPAQPEQTPPQSVAAAPKRYLVVPERIAVQAEASFTSAAPQAAAVEPQAPAETAPAQSAPAQAAPAKAAPAAVVKQTPAPAKPSTPAKRPTQPTATARSKSVPRVAQAPTLETHPNTEPQQPPSAFDGLFPNLRATIGAVDEELQKIRRERAAPEQGSQQQQQQRQPQQQQQPKQPSRAARWPWSFGR